MEIKYISVKNKRVEQLIKKIFILQFARTSSASYSNYSINSCFE